MVNKDLQISDMLKQGKSYTEIQSELHVSPSKISQVKRNLMIDSDNENSGSSTTTTRFGELQTTEYVKDRNQAESKTNDPEVLLKLRKLELEHERQILQMKMEEKEKERKYEEQKNAISSSNRMQEIHKQNQRISQLEENNRDLRDEIDSLYNQDPDEFALPQNLIEKFREFITRFISLDGDRKDLEEIREVLDEIFTIKDEIMNYCEEEGEQYEELVEWEILAEAEEDLLGFKEEIEENYFKTSVRYDFSDEWREKLENCIR